MTTMPGLTIHTDAPAAAAAAAHGANNPPPHQSSFASRASSPTRPPISPITPTLGPAQLSAAPSVDTIPDFALGRPVFIHSQPDQVAVPAPPAVEPVAFDENPDVLALKSAISILQLQRARAAADMQALSRAKAAALADPHTFVADLAAGRVGVDGDPLMFPNAGYSEEDDEDTSEDDDEELGDEDAEEKSPPGSTDGIDGHLESSTTPSTKHMDADGDIPMTVNSIKPDTNATRTQPSRTDKKHKGKQKRSTQETREANAWRKLPKPQSVVRCPPINWVQYGVVGESLDKLHAQQVAAPTPGAPLSLGPGGTYSFKAGDLSNPSGEPPRRLVGIAAPYTPGRDKIEKKAKGGRR
ncbi:hypothetical protein B0T25DRAFT_525842 [Lasiosphaeria hispida]|uniref:Uncharacterized protein n=1 Tax=Lasiosphaeria hispida TaxID=260671 RepID=A0AAJ0HUS3_9PEZI|nr:hypothetical protein B0T25DRAFT_525842 [Lasiosphaeria hispida]